MTHFQNFQTRIDRLQGADPAVLESKVRQYYGTDEGGDEDNTVAGHVSMNNYFNLFTFHVCLVDLMKHCYFILSKPNSKKIQQKKCDRNFDV